MAGAFLYIARSIKIQQNSTGVCFASDFQLCYMTPKGYRGVASQCFCVSTSVLRLIYLFVFFFGGDGVSVTWQRSRRHFKALNKFTPAYISDLLKPMSETHSLSLRSSDNGLLSILRSRSALYDRSFSYSASKLWNSLPQTLRRI